MPRLVYATCPACSGVIKEPFLVAHANYWTARSHHRPNNRDCRIRILVRPNGTWWGDGPHPRDVSYEELLLHATTHLVAA